MSRSKKQPSFGLRKPRKVDNGLSSLLSDTPNDEKGGVNTSLGITYQQWWATLKATDLYAQGTDFAIGMEVKEDVVVLDSPLHPTSVEFYQVKKREQEGLWNWSALLRTMKRKEGGTESSPLAKLYSRRHAFAGHPTKLTFISNLGFKVPLDEVAASLQFSTDCGLHEFIVAKASEVMNRPGF